MSTQTEKLMKKLVVTLLFGLTSVSAYADVSLPVNTIDTFTITTSSKLVLDSRTGVYIAPFSNCSIETIKLMDSPTISFSRPRVRSTSNVVVYDQKNKKNNVRCNIDSVKLYVAKS